nr:IS3 family transposase [Haemophilus haemolyticus]
MKRNILHSDQSCKDYLDYYNHRRIQLKLKGLSPIQYRKQSFK